MKIVTKTTRCDKVQCVVTIDGPAGAGKSTVARKLSTLLGFDFLDTGALYRCVTLAALRTEIDLHDQTAVLRLAESLEIRPAGLRVYLNGEDVSEEIRSPNVSANIGAIADNQAVRSLLTSLQRKCAADRQIVTEGRDQGTVAFPDAACKIFLSASREERAKRRLEELLNRHISADYPQILTLQDRRDAEDAARPVGALRKAEDAVEVCTDGMTLDEVVEQLRQIVVERLGTAVVPQSHRDHSHKRMPTTSE
jgi:CMP/dCMP kinase